MKGLAFGGADWVVDIEATSLMTGSKECVVVIKLSLSTISHDDNTSKLKGIGPCQGGDDVLPCQDPCLQFSPFIALHAWVFVPITMNMWWLSCGASPSKRPRSQTNRKCFLV